MIKARKDDGDLVNVVLDPSHYLYNHSGSYPWLKNIANVKSACGGAVYTSYDVKCVDYACGCIVFFLGNSAPLTCPAGHASYSY